MVEVSDEDSSLESELEEFEDSADEDSSLAGTEDSEVVSGSVELSSEVWFLEINIKMPKTRRATATKRMIKAIVLDFLGFLDFLTIYIL